MSSATNGSTSNHVAKTIKLYIEGKTSARNVNIVQATDTTMILDQTVFHPQGGGQPCDIGTIQSETGNIIFTVSMVKEDRATGLIEHTGSFTKGTLEGLKQLNGSLVLAVDVSRRNESMRNHSAGHLLDGVMTMLGFELKPSKGYHFPDGPYVEYIGDVPADKKEKLPQVLTEEINKLAAKKIQSESRLLTKHEAKELCPDSDFEMFSETDPIRMVAIAGGWCPCGGTHVAHLGEIGTVKVTKTRLKKGILRVNYEVTPPPA